MTFDEFLASVTARCWSTRERYGQALFNKLYEVRPDLADEIRGTEFDPFYFTTQDAALNTCCYYIQERW